MLSWKTLKLLEKQLICWREINWNEWEQGEDEYSEMDSDVYKQAIETAQRLKAMEKLSSQQIAEATGLSVKDVEELWSEEPSPWSLMNEPTQEV